MDTNLKYWFCLSDLYSISEPRAPRYSYDKVWSIEFNVLLVLNAIYYRFSFSVYYIFLLELTDYETHVYKYLDKALCIYIYTRIYVPQMTCHVDDEAPEPSP